MDRFPIQIQIGIEVKFRYRSLLSKRSIPIKHENYLLHNWANIFQRQRTEFVLLEKVVEILLEQLKNKAGVVLVLETLVRPDEIELVGVLLAQTRQDVDFDLTLACVRRVVF